MHQKGFVHGDVKTGNIMEAENGQTKLIDFGFAEKAAASSDQRADLFSLGISLIDMLFKDEISSADKKGGNKENIAARRIKQLPSSTPVELLVFIKRITGVDPARRFLNCAATLAALDRLPIGEHS
jgi:serine/threonine protein kinase